MDPKGLISVSDLIRDHVAKAYVEAARRRGDRRFPINAGNVHKELQLDNLVPSVCNALKSEKFLRQNRLRVISRSGPPSGKSTTVTYTYEFLDDEPPRPEASGGSGGTPQSRQDAWNRLRGALKDVFAEYGGGEAYLRAERASFRDADERK
jgi:hypothetical protein